MSAGLLDFRGRRFRECDFDLISRLWGDSSANSEWYLRSGEVGGEIVFVRPPPSAKVFAFRDCTETVIFFSILRSTDLEADFFGRSVDFDFDFDVRLLETERWSDDFRPLEVAGRSRDEICLVSGFRFS